MRGGENVHDSNWKKGASGVALAGRRPRFPSSDGHPMTDKDINRLLMEYAEYAIQTKFPHSYVSANLFIYYDRHDDGKCVAPDTFLVRRASRGLRSSYKVWKEGHVPDVCFEFVAKTSYRLDPEKKREIYEVLGIPEYYVFDPLHKWLDPPLWAYRLRKGRYVAKPVWSGEIVSPRLGMRMRVEGNWLRFYDHASGAMMLTAEEMTGRAEREAERAEQEARRAEQEAGRAEQEAGRAEQQARRAEQEAGRAELQARRAEQEAQRAEQEARRAENEAGRAEQQARRADVAERRAEALQEEVESLRRQIAQWTDGPGL